MPYRKIEFEVQASMAEVQARLNSITRPKRSFVESLRHGLSFSRAISPPFVGEVSTNSFNIKRDIRYRNSFLPMVRGRLTALPQRTRVSIVMSLHPAVALFMLVWLFAAGTGAFGVVFGQHAAGSLSVLAVFPLGMVAFGIALTCAGFYPEARKAERLLREALNGKGQTP